MDSITMSGLCMGQRQEYEGFGFHPLSQQHLLQVQLLYYRLYLLHSAEQATTAEMRRPSDVCSCHSAYPQISNVLAWCNLQTWS